MEDTAQETEFRSKLSAYCDEKGISKIDGIWLIKPKAGLPQAFFIRLYELIVHQLGGKYTQAGTFELHQTYGTMQISATEQSADVDIEKIVAGPTPRVGFKQDGIEELAADLLTNGQKQRIILNRSQKIGGLFEAIDGNRRVTAAHLLVTRGHLQFKTLKAVIMELSEQEAEELAFIIFHREDLTPLEKGRHFYFCRKKYPQQYPTWQAVADKYGYKHDASILELVNYYLANNPEITVEAPKEPEATPSTPAELARANPPMAPQPISGPRATRIITHAPTNIQPKLREMDAKGASTRDLEEAVRQHQTPTLPIIEPSIDDEQQDYDKAENTEEAKQRTLINSLKTTYPETIVQALAERFNRVNFGGMTTEKLGDLTKKFLAIEHQIIVDTDQLEVAYKQLEGQI